MGTSLFTPIIHLPFKAKRLNRRYINDPNGFGFFSHVATFISSVFVGALVGWVLREILPIQEKVDLTKLMKATLAGFVFWGSLISIVNILSYIIQKNNNSEGTEREPLVAAEPSVRPYPSHNNL